MKNKTTVLFILLSGPFLPAHGVKEFTYNKGERVVVRECDSTDECVTVYSNNVNEGGDFSSPVEFDMIRFETGTFMMGSTCDEVGRNDDEEGAEGKRVAVSITSAFAIGKYEVTQRQWFDVMDENPSAFSKEKYCDDDYIEVRNKKGKRVGMCPDHPVEKVPWSDTKEFFRRLNERDGVTGCGENSRARDCWRLPTEAEWEYAARNRTSGRCFFGGDKDDLEDYAWYSGNSNDQTHRVGLKGPNPMGLHDVYGNVWEWTMDKYAKKLVGGHDPLQENGKYPVIRGGSWYSGVLFFLRSAGRIGYWASGDINVGFRIARTEGPRGY